MVRWLNNIQKIKNEKKGLTIYNRKTETLNGIKIINYKDSLQIALNVLEELYK